MTTVHLVTSTVHAEFAPRASNAVSGLHPMETVNVDATVQQAMVPSRMVQLRQTSVFALVNSCRVKRTTQHFERPTLIRRRIRDAKTN